MLSQRYHILLAALMLALVACQKGDDKGSSSSSAANNTFVYCSEGSPTSFNPQISTDGTTSNAAGKTIYNRLTSFKYGETEVIPQLAESWTVSEDGLNYTFNLKQGIKFHITKYFTPSRELNADDVLFSFNRQRLKDHPYHSVSGGSYEYFNAMEMGSLIKEIVKVDDHTVRFELNRPEAPFIANLAMTFTSILSKEYADQLLAQGTPEKLDTEPVGTGPFIYKSYKKDNMIRYTANEDYFEGKPAIKNLVFSITPDPSVRFQKLKAGECHFINEPSPADMVAMNEDPDIKVLKKSGLNVGYLAMNTKKPPFDKVEVRQAINLALNKDAYINAIYLGNAIKAKNPMPPSMWSYRSETPDMEYNPEKAKELLKKAGLANGFATELWTLPVSRPYNPNGKKMGEMMQADLAKIGIKVKLVSYDWGTYLKKMKDGKHGMLQLGWTGDNGDPDNFLHTLLSCSAAEAGSNIAFWCHKPFDDLTSKAKTTSDLSLRTQLYQKAQAVFAKQLPWVPLAHSVVHRGMAANVEGYKIDPFGHDEFKYVKLK